MGGASFLRGVVGVNEGAAEVGNADDDTAVLRGSGLNETVPAEHRQRSPVGPVVDAPVEVGNIAMPYPRAGLRRRHKGV